MLVWMFATVCFAANKKVSVAQVSDAVDVTEDVDYTITSKTEPFGAMGSVNLVNTDHAVLILKYFKPSLVIKNYMGFIYINGEPAKNDVNCQVKMYSNGAIILPYDKDIKPLTVYSEPNFSGDSSNDFDLRNSSGFMNTLTTAQLNNNIRSFKLKRGYMVTFALGIGGWGYSRCFIADTEDLEIANMPENMDGRVSSYRMFKWNDAKKSGLASDTGSASNSALNASWCYDWGTGVNRYPDTECVPNHIYEDWPSPSSCGGVTYSCHMKTNNEPGNSSDDHPQDVSTVLANWQNLMRTGMRLCSETSHDGSMNHLAQFCDSVDAYGWRCDIVDLHCYWDTGQFNNLTSYSDNYGNGRPIWISEWLWGASWNNNGIFSRVSNRDDFSTSTQNINYNGVKPILDVLNSNSRVERYAYWNSERNCSKIYHNGTLSTLGKYYASMEPGIGFKKSNEFIPKVVYRAPNGIKTAFNKTDRTYQLKWNDWNGDMLDSMVVECKVPGSNSFTRVAAVALKDANSKTGASYTYTDVLQGSGAFYFRVAIYPIGKTTPKYSQEAMVAVGSAQGNDVIQYGKLSLGSLDEVSTDFAVAFDENPEVFMGLITNKNTKMTPANVITSVSKKGFSYQMLPWQKSGETKMTEVEEIPYLAMKAGNYELPDYYNAGEVWIEVGNAKVKSDTVDVMFTKPFPEGVVPIVIAELKPSLKASPIMYKVWDVTNTGFKATAMYEVGKGAAVPAAQTLNYLACTPGTALLGGNENGVGIILSAGKSKNALYGTIGRQVDFLPTNLDGTIDEDAMPLELENAFVFGTLQTYNMATGTILRKTRDVTLEYAGSDQQPTTLTGVYVKRCKDGSAPSTVKDTSSTGDYLGWIVVSEDASTGIETIAPNSTENGQQSTDVYDLSGRYVGNAENVGNFSKGIYIINGKKILIR